MVGSLCLWLEPTFKKKVKKQEPTTLNEAMHMANYLGAYEHNHKSFRKSHKNWNDTQSYENQNVFFKSEGNKPIPNYQQGILSILNSNKPQELHILNTKKVQMKTSLRIKISQSMIIIDIIPCQKKNLNILIAKIMDICLMIIPTPHRIKERGQLWKGQKLQKNRVRNLIIYNWYHIPHSKKPIVHVIEISREEIFHQQQLIIFCLI